MNWIDIFGPPLLTFGLNSVWTDSSETRGYSRAETIKIERQAMSRHGYSDDIDEWALIRWRGQVASAIRGKRGQQLLIDLVQALDAMPEKVLIAEKLIDHEDGDAVCALGAVGIKRGIPMEVLDPEEHETVAEAFDIAEQLAREITYINDEGGSWKETPQRRWERVRAWAVERIQPVPVEAKQ